MKIILGSRGSELALKQTELVIESLKEAYDEYEYEIKIIHTKGDKILDRPLEKIGDKGVFVKEIEEQLLKHEIDIAVHSMKDMPGTCAKGLVFTDTLQSDDCRDCLVLNGYSSLDEVPKGAMIGTGSKRRKYQLLRMRPDLEIVDIRGNINTRIQKMYDLNYAGIVLAAAGIHRIGRDDLITEYLDPCLFIPACAQGILGIEVREDSELLAMINRISDKEATTRMHLERAFLETIDGSCHIPMGAHCRIEGQSVHVYAMLGNEEGKLLFEDHIYELDDAYENIKALAISMKGQL